MLSERQDTAPLHLCRRLRGSLELAKARGTRPLLAEALGLARLVARGLLSASTVSRALGGAAEMVGLPAAEVAAAIAWALAHSRGGEAREMG
jgi:hypothetical protein